MCLTMASPAIAWTPKPWQKYVIDQQVKADTATVNRSIMFAHTFHWDPAMMGSMQCGPYYQPDAPSLFEEQDQREEDRRILQYGYSTTDFIADMFSDVLTAIFSK